MTLFKRLGARLGAVGRIASALALSLITVGSIPAAPSIAHASTVAASPTAELQPMSAAAPKVYVGLFKDDAVAVIDSATNQVLRTIPVPEGPHGLVLTADGAKAYVSSDGSSTVSVIDTATDRVVRSIEVGDTPHGLSISRDGRWVVVSGFGSDQAETIDTQSDEVVVTSPVLAPHNSAISPDGTVAYVASQATPSALVAVDLRSGAQLASVPLSAQPRAMSFSPDGEQVFFTTVGSDAVHVLDPATNRIVDEIPVGASPHYPTFTPDGYGALVVAQGPGELDVVDAEDHDLEERIAVGTFPHWLAISDDGSTAYVSNEGSNDVSVVNLRTDTVMATIPVGNAPRKIAIQPGAMSQASGSTAASLVSTDGHLVTTGNMTEDDGDQLEVNLTVDDYAFTPSSLQGVRGQTVTLSLQNAAGTLHNFSIAGLADQDIPARGSATVDVTLLDSGALDFFCKYHAALGMRGQIVVQSAA